MRYFIWTDRLLRWTLGSIFIYAGGIKLGSPAVFVTLIEAYGMVPELLLMPVAICLPVVEIAAGIGLLLNIKASLTVIAALLIFFVALLACGLWMGLDVDCGCFGPGDPEAEAFHGLRTALFRDLAMLAGITFMVGLRRRRPELQA